MDLKEVVHLSEGEAVTASFRCNFPTKKEQLIDRIEEKKFLLLFPYKITVKEAVEKPIELDGELFLTNKALYFVSTAGLIFKRNELILTAEYEELQSVVTQGIIFKELVISLKREAKPDAKVVTYIFRNLSEDAEAVKAKIGDLRSIKISETKSQQGQVKEEDKQAEVSPTAVEKTKNFCSSCGIKLKEDAKFCHACGEKL